MSNRKSMWRASLRVATSLLSCATLFSATLHSGCASEQGGSEEGAPPVSAGVLTLDDARALEIELLQSQLDRMESRSSDLTDQELAHIDAYAAVLGNYSDALAERARGLVESIASRDGVSLAEAAARVTEEEAASIPELYEFGMNISFELATGFGDAIELGAVEQPLCIFAKITLALLVVTVIGLAYQIYRTENPPPPQPPPIPQGGWICVRPGPGDSCLVYQCMLTYVKAPAVPTSSCDGQPFGACKDNAGNPVQGPANCLPVAQAVVIPAG